MYKRVVFCMSAHFLMLNVFGGLIYVTYETMIYFRYNICSSLER